LPSILIVQPDSEDPPERFGDWFAREGFDVLVIRPYDGDVVPTTLEEDALVVLGGDMSAGDVADFPWLADIMELLKHTVAGDLPTLGICLGGQLLAASLGGRVEVGAAGMEAGTVVVNPRVDAEADELMGELPWPLRMITMHRDAITELPCGAVWLADSEPYSHQAFRVGSAAWGVQFHPEVSPATYADWATYVKDTGEALQRVVDGVVDVKRDDQQIVVGAEALAKAFTAVVRRRAKSSDPAKRIRTVG
jgi:GMP synthase (glutamine-hydrolysing)